MDETLQTILITAVVTALLTLGLFFLLFRFYILRKLNQELDQSVDAFIEQFRKSFEEAAIELLPQFRNEVIVGFKEGINAALSGNFLEQTARSAVKTGSDLMGNSLKILFGQEDKEKEKD